MHFFFFTHCEFHGVGCLRSVELEIFKVGEVPGGPATPGSKPHVLFVLGVGVHVEGVVTHAVTHPLQELAEVSLGACERYLTTPPRDKGGGEHGDQILSRLVA